MFAECCWDLFDTENIILVVKNLTSAGLCMSLEESCYEPNEVSTITALTEKCRHRVGKLPMIKENRLFMGRF